MKISSSLLFAGMATAATVVAVIAGLAVIGSPTEQRLKRLDKRRLTNLQSIAREIDSRWQDQKSLPRDLEALGQSRAWLVLSDPVTGVPYEYRVTGNGTYELCATFETVVTEHRDERKYSRFWDHGRGRHCYLLDARDGRKG
jgi:hypothetical protein